MSPSTTRSDAVRRGFGHLGLAVTVVLATVTCLLLTLVWPPWREVVCQRRQILYWSERVTVHKASFAGFDGILSQSKWTSIRNPPNPASDTLFESREFEIHKPVLAVEWLLLVTIAGSVWYRLSRQVFPPALPRSEPPASS